MKVLTVGYSVKHAGAERIGWSIYQQVRQLGAEIDFAVARPSGDDEEGVIELGVSSASSWLSRSLYRLAMRVSRRRKFKGKSRLIHLILLCAQPSILFRDISGREIYWKSNLREIVSRGEYDIVHFHNIRPATVNLADLEWVSRKCHVVWTLHDMWAFTGHCGYSLDCEKWRELCISCPQSKKRPFIWPVNLRADGARSNFIEKEVSFKGMKINYVTPSAWLRDLAEESILLPSINKAEVIYNGIDQQAFGLQPKAAARRRLGLPEHGKIILMVGANVSGNHVKGYSVGLRACELCANLMGKDDTIRLVALGGAASISQRGSLIVDVREPTSELSKIASYYQAADVFLHPALMDNLPTTIIESLSCGTPVVASSVGGIPEMIVDIREDAANGYGWLSEAGDVDELADILRQVLGDYALRELASSRSYHVARARFSDAEMAKQYFRLYKDLCGTDILD